MTEFAWVIERNDGGGGIPEYWTGRGPDTFASMPDEAIRFARLQDAITVMYWTLSDEGRAFCHAREHGWDIVNPIAANPSDGTRGER